MENCNEHRIDWSSSAYRICPLCYHDDRMRSGQPRVLTSDLALDDKIAELEGRAKEIITAREERLLEQTGDHGRPDDGSGGFRWL